MASDEVLVTYRENALPALRFNVREVKEALTYEDIRDELDYFSDFFTGRHILHVAGVVNEAQYQRAIDGEKSLERLAYLGDFQKIKENERKIDNFSDLAKEVNSAYDKTKKICELVNVESYYNGASSFKEIAGIIGTAPAALGIFFIATAGSFIELIIGGIMGLPFPFYVGVQFSKELSKEEAAIRQLKAMIPFYAEQVAQDIQALPRNITYLEALCSHVEEAVQENVFFYPQRELEIRMTKNH